MKAPRLHRWVQIATVGLAVTFFGLPRSARGQGWIEPLEGRNGGIERLETEVHVRVVGQVAQVEVTEWFENHGRGLAEGTYLYPLPGEAVFGSFSLWQGEQELRGEVLDAQRAREVYEGIVRRKKDPALIELAGMGLLRASVFPIEPGQKRKVTLRYDQVLEVSGDALQFRYAAGTQASSNTFPVRVEPDPRPRRLPDQEIDAGRPPERTDLELELVADDGARFLEPFSPTHRLKHERDDGRLVVRADGELRGRLSIFLPLAREGVGLALATHRTPGEDGYFMLTLTPGSGEALVQPRDVTVVLDVSGSMSGVKMQQARAAMLQLLASLSPEDRFRLIAFSNRVRPESEGWRPGTADAVASARQWVERLVADGGTDISSALDEALRLETPEGRLPIVVFLTDGLPTAGEVAPERIAERVERTRGNARVFAFGVGHDVDTHLLDALSAAARGTTTYVDPGEDVERALALLATKIRHPVLTDLEIADAPAALREIYPVTLPDLFAGEALVLFGRYAPSNESGGLTVRGRRGVDALTFSTDARFPEREEGNAYMPRLWASRKIGHLSRQIRLEGATPALIEEVRSTALRYGLPSDYTSYLVLEPGVVAQDGGRTPPPSAPGNAAGAVSNRVATTGAKAVEAAAEQALMREVRTGADLDRMDRSLAMEAAKGDVRSVAGRLFKLQDGVWTEVESSRPAPSRKLEVKLYSEAYFGLIDALPELLPIAGALGNVEVRGTAVTVRLAGEGRESIGSDELAHLVRDFRATTAGAAGRGPLEERR
jgi:Ca-activated chloride channel family protein